MTKNNVAKDGRPIRVVVQQPALPLYRVPIFQQLNSRGDLELRVRYGHTPGLPNAAADGFEASPSRERRFRVLGRTLVWDPSQWAEATKRRADVVVFTWNRNYLSLIPSILRARMSGVGVVLWGHGRSIGQTTLRRRLRSWVARLADTVVCYGTRGASENIEQGVQRDVIFVAPNSLDERPAIQQANSLLAGRARLAEFQRRMGIDGSRLILFVSRLQRGNRLDLLCDALPLVAAAIPNVRVVIIGAGDEERERLQRLSIARGVASRVRFIGPIYGESDLAPWFLSADVMCYPENVGLSALHAFAYGLPIVCCDDLDRHNPEAEAVVDGVSGRLFKQGSALDLARVLREVLEDESERRRLCRGARQMIDDRYNVANMTNVMAAAISAAAGRGQ